MSPRQLWTVQCLVGPGRSSETDVVTEKERNFLDPSIFGVKAVSSPTRKFAGLTCSRRPYGAADRIWAANPGLRSPARTCPWAKFPSPYGAGDAAGCGRFVANWEVSAHACCRSVTEFVLICASEMPIQGGSPISMWHLRCCSRWLLLPPHRAKITRCGPRR